MQSNVPISSFAQQLTGAKRPKAAVAFAGLAIFATCCYAAETPDAVFVDLLSSSPRISASRRDAEGAQARRDEVVRRSWAPNLSVVAETGMQKYGTESIAGDRRNADIATVRLTQLVHDFGRTGQQINEADAVIQQMTSVSDATRDGVLLEGLTAHWSAVRARAVLEYARRSEASVQNLTKIESFMVELGRGYESNVLQAKVQLAGAEARRVRSEGALSIADARVAAVFGNLASRVTYEQVAQTLSSRIPATLDDAINAALNANKQLQVGAYRSQAIAHRASSTSARENFPRLEMVAERSRRNNWDTTVNNARINDDKLMLQLTWNFNLGFAGSYARDSLNRDYEASLDREAETKNLVMEQVAIAWRNLLVARQNRETLANQVRIAGKFFEMASAERQMGRRSLLEVLSAEVSLISAMSDLVSAEADGHIAALTLLQATGNLDLGAVQFVPAAQVLTDAAAIANR